MIFFSLFSLDWALQAQFNASQMQCLNSRCSSVICWYTWEMLRMFNYSLISLSVTNSKKIQPKWVAERGQSASVCVCVCYWSRKHFKPLSMNEYIKGPWCWVKLTVTVYSTPNTLRYLPCSPIFYVFPFMCREADTNVSKSKLCLFFLSFFYASRLLLQESCWGTSVPATRA